MMMTMAMTRVRGAGEIDEPDRLKGLKAEYDASLLSAMDGQAAAKERQKKALAGAPGKRNTARSSRLQRVKRR
jgi:hypothetical protein